MAGCFRMNVAQMWIKEENLALIEIASRLGYDSETAFSRAFKRIIGVTPGTARRIGVGDLIF
jgi:AraC-like DNA-binding protein